jgi:serine/threonine-protein kinase
VNDNALPDSFGTFRVEREIGRGGMGVVYLARDASLDRHVAIKVLAPELAADPDRLMRLRREARALAALNHPNIAAIYGMEEDPQRGRFLILEWVEGRTLAEVIEDGPLPPAQALEFARQVADALEAAHDAGVVHRDLKPANIKLRDDGAVKVLDFGLAKGGSTESDSGSHDLEETLTIVGDLTAEGVVLGTAYLREMGRRTLAAISWT